MGFELKGVEFDWFAIDDDGNIAMFATAGEGFLPESVEAVHQRHSAVSALLDSPHWGSSAVWNDFSSQGLFVFDWDLPDGPYLKQASPTQPMIPDLRTNILANLELPRFRGKFPDQEKIERWS